MNLILVLAMVVAAALAASIATMIVAGKRLQRSMEAREHAEQQIRALVAALQGLESRLAKLEAIGAPRPHAIPVPAAPISAPAIPPPPKKKEEEITPDLLVVMAAAVTVFLGKTVRIRSAKRLQSPYEIVNPWAQQGRVFVQASHNLR